LTRRTPVKRTKKKRNREMREGRRCEERRDPTSSNEEKQHRMNKQQDNKTTTPKPVGNPNILYSDSVTKSGLYRHRSNRLVGTKAAASTNTFHTPSLS
jgi:hypothetical protein